MSTPASQIAKQVTQSTTDLRARLIREISAALLDFTEQTGLQVESLQVDLFCNQSISGQRLYRVSDIQFTITG